MTDLTEKSIQEFLDDPKRTAAELVCPPESLPGIVLVLEKGNGRLEHHLAFGHGHHCVLNPHVEVKNVDYILSMARSLGLTAIRNPEEGNK